MSKPQSEASKPLKFSSIKDSRKAAHQKVLDADREIGEVWRAQVHVTVSKLSAPRVTRLKWRWFGRRLGDARVLGTGSRVAVLLGAGYDSRAEVIKLLQAPTPQPALAGQQPLAAAGAKASEARPQEESRP